MMRRGFKAESTRLALEIRAEFHVSIEGRFDPYEFAAEYGIPVVELGTLVGPARDHFYHSMRGTLSGALIKSGSGFVILDNDAHPTTRRHATVSHEISHYLLEHEFVSVLSSNERGCGIGAEQEEEAKFLSGELLIPTEGAIRHALKGRGDEQVARFHGVSVDFADGG
jgi:Zn-dependent peptidase ImmA (M78 family)